MSCPIGPALPPHLAKAKATNDTLQDHDEVNKLEEPISKKIVEKEEEREEKDEEEDDNEDSASSYGPSLPPELLARRQTTVARKVIGPALPSTIQTSSYEQQEEEDDSLGPMPLTGEAAETMAKIEHLQRIAEIEARAAGKTVGKSDDNKEVSSKPTRGEWMLVPPTADLSMDPLKKRPTGFRQVEGRGYRGPREEHDNFLWTESPADREKRLIREHEEKEHGRPSTRRPAPSTFPAKKSSSSNPVVASRGPSLMEQHLATLQDKKKDKSQKRSTASNSKNGDDDDEQNLSFDRERDMAVQRVDIKRQRTMLQKGNLLNDRFSRGK